MSFLWRESVLWLHEMRGGYGYVERIPAMVIRTTRAGRVTIKFYKTTGEVVYRSVKPESLEHTKRAG